MFKKLKDCLCQIANKDILEINFLIEKIEDNPVEYSEHGFYQDSNGKWFFLCTLCKYIKGKAYGYEIGWRRKDLNGVNAVIRIHFGKPIERVNE